MPVAPKYEHPDLDLVGQWTTRAYATLSHPPVPGTVHTKAHLWLMRGEIVAPTVPRQVLVVPSSGEHSLCWYCVVRTKGRAVVCDAANRVLRVEVICAACYERRGGGLRPQQITDLAANALRLKAESKSPFVRAYAAVRLRQLTECLPAVTRWHQAGFAEVAGRAPGWLLESLRPAPEGWIDTVAAARLDRIRAAKMSRAELAAPVAAEAGADDLLTRMSKLVDGA